MDVKFHKNCENTGRISCARCNFVKIDIHFLGHSKEIFFAVITDY